MLGIQGRISDGGVYRNSSLFSLISQNALNLPPPRPLPKSKDSSWTPFESNEEVPFVFVADDAFPLSNICLKPYPENGLTDRKRGFADEIQGDMVVDGQWRSENSDTNMQPLMPRRHGNNNAKAAAELRDIFADHFDGPGQVPWQWNHIMAKK
eukprot:gene4182-20368_t